MVNWTPENENKLLLAIFETQQFDKKKLLEACQADIDPSMDAKALANKMMRMKTAAKNKGDPSPKKLIAAVPTTPKKNAKPKSTLKVNSKRGLGDSDGYFADESEALESPTKKVKTEQSEE